MRRTENTLRNVKWGMLHKTVNMLLPFLVRTIIIYSLGVDYLGLNSLFASILSVLNLTELGFSNAIVYSMYKPIAEGDKDKVCALLRIYKTAYTLIGVIILVLGFALTPLLPKLINGDCPSDINIYILYYVYLFNTVISYLMFAYKTSLLSAHQREDVLSKSTLVSNLLMYAVQIFVLVFLKNYYAYVLVLPVSTVALNIMNNNAVNKLFPDYIPKGKISEDENRILKKNIIGLTIWKIGCTTRNTFDSIVISMYLGLTTVAMYNNYFYIISALNVILGVLATSITAGIGNKIALESSENNYSDFRKFHFLYMLIVSWCTVCLMCLYQPFMKVWVGEDLMFSEGIVILFCYYFIMLKQGDINSIYYQASGLWWKGRWRSVVEAVLNLVLNLVLGKKYGVVGIIFATIISYTLVYFYGSSIVFTEYFKNKKTHMFFIENIIYKIITLLVALVSYILIHLFVDKFMVVNKFAELVITALICVFVSGPLFLLFYGIKKQNREYMMYLTKKLRTYILKRDI